MRVCCPNCQTKAIITSSNVLSETVKDLYCQCTNTQACGASFVFTLAYKHTISPPINTTKEMAAALLRTLPADEQRALLNNTL